MLSSIPTRREMLASALAIVVTVTAMMLARPDPVGAGAPAGGPTTQVVYIATGENFPDALGAAATAAVGLGPVLLVQQNSIPAPTLAELNRLQPDNIVIVGGTAVVSNAVETQLAGLGFSPGVTRIAGTNRYDTAAQLSQATFPTSGMYPRAASDSRSDSSTFIGTEAVRSATVEASAAGVLVINGGFNITTAPPVSMSCSIQILDIGITIPGSLRTVASSERSCQTSTTVVVAAGSYDVRLLGNSGGIFDPMTVNHGSLSVVWIPFDGSGATPAP
jgi:hypothetical protein